MAWIESHQTVWAHAKTRKAARILGVPDVQLVGHLHALWHWAIDHAEDGNLSKYDADDLAIAARWDGDPGVLVAALVDCGPGDSAGYLERGGAYGPPEDGTTGDLVLHDWWGYAGKLIARRRADRDRKRASRGPDSSGCPEDVPPTSDGQAADVPTPSTPPSLGRATNQPTVDQPTNQPTSSRKRADRATRLPDDWRPGREPELVAAVGGQDAAKREWEKFRDYWRARAGKDGRKVDWQATWRNWLRKAAEDRPQGNARASPSRSATYAAAWAAKADELEAAEGEDTP